MHCIAAAQPAFKIFETLNVVMFNKYLFNERIADIKDCQYCVLQRTPRDHVSNLHYYSVIFSRKKRYNCMIKLLIFPVVLEQCGCVVFMNCFSCQ